MRRDQDYLKFYSQLWIWREGWVDDEHNRFHFRRERKKYKVFFSIWYVHEAAVSAVLNFNISPHTSMLSRGWLMTACQSGNKINFDKNRTHNSTHFFFAFQGQWSFPNIQFETINILAQFTVTLWAWDEFEIHQTAKERGESLIVFPSKFDSHSFFSIKSHIPCSLAVLTLCHSSTSPWLRVATSTIW